MPDGNNQITELLYPEIFDYLTAIEKRRKLKKTLGEFQVDGDEYNLLAAIDAGISEELLVDAFGQETYQKALAEKQKPVEPTVMPEIAFNQQPLEWFGDVEKEKQFEQEVLPTLPQELRAQYANIPMEEFAKQYNAFAQEQGIKEQDTIDLFKSVVPQMYEGATEETERAYTQAIIGQLKDNPVFAESFFTRIQQQGRTPETEQLLQNIMPQVTEQDMMEFFTPKESEIDVKAIVKGEVAPPTSPEIEEKKNLWTSFYGALRKAAYQTEQGINILLTRLPLTDFERQQFSQSMLQNKNIFDEWVKKHPEVEPPAEITEFRERTGKLPFLQQLGEYVKNPQAMAYTMAEGAPPTLAALGAFTGVTFLTGSPILGGIASFATFAPMQISDVAQDLINAGASEEQAYQLAVPVGALISALDVVGDIPILKALSPALKPFEKGIQKAIVNKTMLAMIKKGLVTFTAEEFTETMTEVAQQVIQDYTVSYFDNRNPFANINQTAVQTLIQVAPFALFGGVVSATTVRNGQPVKLTEIYNESLAAHKKEGLTDQEARVQALNDVARIPEGEVAIKKAYDSIAETGKPPVVEAVPKAEAIPVKVPEAIELVKEVPEQVPQAVPQVPAEPGMTEVTKLTTSEAMKVIPSDKEFGITKGKEIVSIPQGPGLTARPIKGIVDHIEVRRFTDGTPNPTTSDVIIRDSAGKLRTLGVNQIDMEASGLKPALPTAEPGMPEAGLQPSMLGEAPVEVRPQGKGKVTQISMEDQLKLEQARREVIPEAQRKAYEAQAELEGLKEWLQSEPASKLTNLIKKIGWSKGEVKNLTLKQYRDLTGKTEIPPNILTEDKKHVRWEYSLDYIATEQGYESGEALKEAIEKTGNAQARIKELETEVARLPVEPSVKVQDIPLSVLDATSMTREETEMTLQLFTDALQSKELTNQRVATIELRKRVLARRASNAKSRAEQLVIEGKTPGDAVKQAESEFMSGKLPTVDSQFMIDVSDEMRTVLEAKAYDYWTNVEPNWFELMSTIDALHNALRTGNIPRKIGTGSKAFPNGGSAYLRLQRAFGGQPEVLLALDKGIPFEDIIEGVFRPSGQEPVQLDQNMLDYLRGLGTTAMQEVTGLEIPGEGRGILTYDPTGKLGLNIQGQQFALDRIQFTLPTVEDIRTAAEKEFALRKLQLDTLLSEKKISRDNYDIELAIATEKVKPYPQVTRYDAPINEAFKQPSIIPMKHRALIVRALQETGATATDIGNFLRANQASFDFSWWRQVAPMIVNNLDSWMLGNISGWKSIWSEKTAEADWLAIIHDMEYQIYDELGLDFLRPKDLPKGTKQWQGVEEFGFLGTDRPIPKFTAALPWVKISQRAFISGINRMLWNNFKKFYKAQLKISEKVARGDVKLKPGESFSIKENMRQFGRMMEDMSGRARLGKASAIAPAANALFFSLRLNLGRLLTPRHLVASNKYVRAEAWKNLTTFVGTFGGVILMGAALGWWDVERDPRSADFMKIRIGNIRVDPWGGYQQFVVFFARVITQTGLVSSTGAEYQVNRLDAMVNFIRGKASPLVSVISDFTTGRNFLGEKVDVKDVGQWLDRVVPFALHDVWDAFTEKGTEGALIGLPAIFGANVQTYSGDWTENAKKLGLPKYDDLVIQGIDGPKYTIEDFWSDHAAEFKGVDPATLTEKKGFHPRIKAIAEAQQVLEQIDIIPNVKLTSINADPEKGLTFEKYRAQ